MDEKLSYSTFGVARTLMAICVFFCHVFERFNDFGFLFVGVFFFMSGYGMEIGNRRKQSLVRLVPYILYFVWFSLLYFFFFNVWIYPSSWFLVIYFLVMLIYRFVSNIYLLLGLFLMVAFFLVVMGFEFGWATSYGAFLFGVFYARNRDAFHFRNVLIFLPMTFFVVLRLEVAFWCFLPLFSWIVLSISSKKILRPLASLGQYSFFFYCVHCFLLRLFGCTWTLGGSPSFWGCIAAFGASVIVSVLLKDYLFNYPKIQKEV